MRPYKKFVLLVISFTFLFMGSILSINFIIEPYGLFRQDFTKQRIEPNQNFIKMKYILSHSEKYDSYLFGSSRVGKIDVKKIDNGTYYNMTYSEGVPGEHLNNIKIMLSHGVKIKNLAIGLDDFSYKVDPALHFQQKMRYPYTEKEFLYYFKYLFDFPSFENVKMYLSNDVPYFFTFYDIFDTGRPLIDNIDASINSNTERHVTDPKFTQPTHYEGDRITETIQDLKEIADLAKEHRIRLLVFINPIHAATYIDANPQQFNRFKRELANITDYYDFSGLNSITTQNINYYETSHYRVNIGDLMIYRMFKDVPLDEDFGVYVTRNNIDMHIKNLEQQFIDYYLANAKK